MTPMQTTQEENADNTLLHVCYSVFLLLSFLTSTNYANVLSQLISTILPLLQESIGGKKKASLLDATNKVRKAFMLYNICNYL